MPSLCLSFLETEIFLLFFLFPTNRNRKIKFFTNVLVFLLCYSVLFITYIKIHVAFHIVSIQTLILISKASAFYTCGTVNVQCVIL